jgi:hypothetical protein
METLAAPQNHRLVAQILASLATVVFLLGSLPLGDGLGPVWWGVLLLLLSGALVRWGPELSSAGAGRIPLLVSVAVFTTSMLSSAEARGELLLISIICTTTLIVLGGLLRLVPTTASLSRLRVAALVAIAAFAFCLRTALHSGLACMKQGDFWVVDLPFKQALILPHPYDFYVVERGVRLFLWAAMLASLGVSALYFYLWRRLRHVNAGGGFTRDEMNER